VNRRLKKAFTNTPKLSFSMLILSRKIEQSIIINGNIVVKVLGVDRDVIKLGIDAPKEVVVNREEIQLAIEGARVHPGDVPKEAAA